MLRSLNEYIDAPSLRHTAVQFEYRMIDSLVDKMQSSMTRAVMCLLHTIFLNFVGIRIMRMVEQMGRHGVHALLLTVKSNRRTEATGGERAK